MTYVEQFAVKNAASASATFWNPSRQGACDCHLPCNPGADENRQIRISQEELFGDILIESLEDEDTVVVPYTDETDSEDKTDGRTEQE